MSESLKTAAQAAVARLLAVLEVDNVPPVDVREIAFMAGVDAVYFSDDLIGDGRLEYRGARTAIAIARGARPVRQRYTLAHELGHYWLRSSDQTLLQSLRPDDEERFCNMFAAELLLPQPWILEHGHSYPPTLERLREISSVADVSLLACFISLRRIPHWRRSLLYWRRLQGAWMLNSVIGVAEDVRSSLQADAETDHAIRIVAQLPRSEATCDLPLKLGGVAIKPRAEVAVSSEGAVALTDLPRLTPVTGQSHRPRPRTLMAFAVPRPERPSKT
jgi:hypothetical protein